MSANKGPGSLFRRGGNSGTPVQGSNSRSSGPGSLFQNSQEDATPAAADSANNSLSGPGSLFKRSQPSGTPAAAESSNRSYSGPGSLFVNFTAVTGVVGGGGSGGGGGGGDVISASASFYETVLTSNTSSITNDIIDTDVIVDVNGARQTSADFSVSGTTITFTNMLYVGDTIQLTVFAEDEEEDDNLEPASPVGGRVFFEHFDTELSADTTKVVDNSIDSDSIIVVRGIIANTSEYSVEDNVVTFNETLFAGDRVQVFSFGDIGNVPPAAQQSPVTPAADSTPYSFSIDSDLNYSFIRPDTDDQTGTIDVPTIDMLDEDNQADHLGAITGMLRHRSDGHVTIQAGFDSETEFTHTVTQSASVIHNANAGFFTIFVVPRYQWYTEFEYTFVHNEALFVVDGVDITGDSLVWNVPYDGDDVLFGDTDTDWSLFNVTILEERSGPVNANLASLASLETLEDRVEAEEARRTYLRDEYGTVLGDQNEFIHTTDGGLTLESTLDGNFSHQLDTENFNEFSRNANGQQYAVTWDSEEHVEILDTDAIYHFIVPNNGVNQVLEVAGSDITIVTITLTGVFGWLWLASDTTYLQGNILSEGFTTSDYEISVINKNETDIRIVTMTQLKRIAEDSDDFAAFKTAIANL